MLVRGVVLVLVTPACAAIPNVEAVPMFIGAIQVVLSVVKDHALSTASALPATSVTPPAPPLIVAVYWVLGFPVRSAVGLKVAINVSGS